MNSWIYTFSIFQSVTLIIFIDTQIMSHLCPWSVYSSWMLSRLIILESWVVAPFLSSMTGCSPQKYVFFLPQSWQQLFFDFVFKDKIHPSSDFLFSFYLTSPIVYLYLPFKNSMPKISVLDHN